MEGKKYLICYNSLLEKDLPRTRSSDERIQKQSVQKCLRRIATFFCLQNNYNYQQGLLEVALPFALLHSKRCKTSKCYAYFNLFMKKHVPKVLMQRTINNKKELPHTILAINLVNCLLNFHYPSISETFAQQQIELSLIATQQLMTIFAKKLEIQYVYMIYDKLIKSQSPNFLFFMCVSMIGLREEEIALKKDDNDFINFVQNLKKVQSRQDIENWFQLAEVLKSETPHSFSKIIQNLGFAQKNILSLEDLENMLNSDNFFSLNLLPIYLSEVNEALEKFVLVTENQSLPKKYSSMRLSNSSNYNRNKLHRKVLIIVIHENENKQKIMKLLSFCREFQLCKIGILRQTLEMFRSQLVCSIF